MSRGFTLIEILIATALAAIVSASLLMVVRTQLMAYELNDQVTRAQQNGRAATDFIEAVGRRACGGLSVGAVGLNVPSVPSQVTSCLRWYDGAIPAGGTFTLGGQPTQTPDAVEIIYATPPFTQMTQPASLTAAPSVSVANITGFNPGDLVLIGDYQQGVLFQIDVGGVVAGTTAPQGTLMLKAPAGAVAAPTSPALNLGSSTLTVMKAQSISLYVSTLPPYKNMLMFDPDGMVGVDHSDAQPLGEGVIDLQLAVGIDANGDGLITEGGVGDEWIGNAPSETVPPPPWDRAGLPDPQLKQLRWTVLVQTYNVYPGTFPALGPFEDRTQYPPTSGGSPRSRPLRILVAPRVWNLLN